MTSGETLSFGMAARYRIYLIILHSVGILQFISLDWLAIELGGCDEYGLPDCKQQGI